MNAYHLQPFIEKMTRDMIWKLSCNEYDPGQQLPSIEDMAKQYGVGRSTIREALKHMQSVGLIHSQHGKGTFLVEYPSADHYGTAILEHILDLRRMLEIHAIRQAVIHRNPKHLKKLGELFMEMETCITSRLRFTDADRNFHITIAVASGNPFLPGIYHNISGIFAGLQDAIVDLPGSQEKALNEHAIMLKALEKQDENLAEKVMNQHLDSIVKQIREKRI